MRSSSWLSPAASLLLCSSTSAFVAYASTNRVFLGKAPAATVTTTADGSVDWQKTKNLRTTGAVMSAGKDKKTGVLFVCLGNICRSPTAEAVFKQVTEKAGVEQDFYIDSCGTGGGNPDWYKEDGFSYHEGDPPDARMTAAAEKRGVTLSGGSRPLRPEDLDTFDLIVGMDPANSKAISTAAEYWGKKEAAEAKTRTMTSFCRSNENVKSVPDPYYGGVQGFETVLDLLDDACQGLLDAVREGNT